MRKTTGLVTFLLSSVAFGAVAMAADPLPPPVIIAPTPVVPPAPTTLAAYVDLHGGFTKGWEDEYFEIDDLDDHWEFRGPIIGGAGRAAYQFSPGFGIQLDAWSNIWAYTVRAFGDDDVLDDEFHDTVGTGGIATHLIFGTGAFQFGALASVGGEPDHGLFANVGLEAAGTFGNFRVFTQVGYSIGIHSEPKDDGERDLYARVAGTFYVNPGLAISANIGWDRWTEKLADDTETTFTYGARVEMQLGTSPFTVFAAYQAYRWNGVDNDDPFTWFGKEHNFIAGVRVLIGRDTLQETDAAVPFADVNMMYGDPFAAH